MEGRLIFVTGPRPHSSGVGLSLYETVKAFIETLVLYVFKMTLMSVIQFFTLGLVFLSQSVLACEISNLYTQNSDGAETSYIDVFNSNGREQYVLFAQHVGDYEQGLRAYILALSAQGTPEQKAELAADLRKLIADSSGEIARRRENLTNLRPYAVDGSSNSQFDYVGLENPPGEAGIVTGFVNDHDYINYILNSDEAFGLSEAEVQEVLWALFDEATLLRNRVPAIREKTHPTEDEQAFADFGPLIDACSSSMAAVTALELSDQTRSHLEAYRTAVFTPNFDIDELTRLHTTLVEGISGADNLSDPSLFQKVQRDCLAVVSSPVRDNHTANIMLNELPTGRGFISRGTAHRDRLHEQFMALCQGGSSGPVPSGTGLPVGNEQ